METNNRCARTKAKWCLIGLIFLAMIFTDRLPSQNPPAVRSWWQQEYSVRRDDTTGKLALSTPYYSIQHDLKKGGAIEKISLTHGKVPNLILRPMETSIRLKMDSPSPTASAASPRVQDTFSDLNAAAPSVVQTKDGRSIVVTVESPLVDRDGKPSGVTAKTVYTYRWGYIKIHKEISAPQKSVRVRNVAVLSTLVDPSLTDYGWRPSVFEEMGATPHAWQNGQIRQWGKIRPGTHFDLPFQTRYVPRYIVLANPGIEGLEWFMADDLSQWDFQVTGTPGTGYCELRPSVNPIGIAVSIMPLQLSPSFDLPQGGWVPLQGTWSFDYFISVPILEGHANKPWLNMSYQASEEAMALYRILKPLGDIEQYKFEDGRNKAVKLDDRDCLTAVYSKAGEACILLANVDPNPKKVRVRIDPKSLAYPLASIASAEILGKGAASLQPAILAGAGEEVAIPADDVILIRIK